MKYIFSFGTIMILALFMAGCNSSGSSSPPPTPPPKTEAVYLQPTTVILDVGTSEKFQALAVDENGETTDVTDQASWSLVNNNNTVELDATDPSLVKALAVGNDSVTASYSGVTSDPAPVTVVEETLASLTITPTDVTMVVTTTQAFTAEGTYNTGRTQDLTDESSWASDNPVFVSMEGNIATAVKDTTVANIIASYEGIDSPPATVATFDVIQSLEMFPDVTELFNGQTQHYRALATFASSATPQDITDKANWTSSDTGVLVALGDKGVFKAIGPGTSTITASHTNTVNDKVSITKTITVLDVFLDRIEIRPANSSVAVGKTREYNVFGINTDGTEYLVNNHVNLKMTVSGDGKAYFEQAVNSKIWVLHATGAGDITITADLLEPGTSTRPPEEHQDSALLTITP